MQTVGPFMINRPMISKSKNIFIHKFVKPSAKRFRICVLCGLFFLFLVGVVSNFSMLLQRIFPPSAQYSGSNMHFNNQWIRSDLFAAEISIDSVFITENDINQVHTWYQNEGWPVCDLENTFSCFKAKLTNSWI